MLQFSDLTIETAVANRSEAMKTAVANQGGAMEADTISKNGTSSKSLMSRINVKKESEMLKRNVNLKLLGLTFLLPFVMNACKKTPVEDPNAEEIVRLTAQEKKQAKEVRAAIKPA